jgi:hypothetical protein
MKCFLKKAHVLKVLSWWNYWHECIMRALTSFMDSSIDEFIVEWWKENEEARHTKKKSATFVSSRSLLGRGNLRATLSHQSNTVRGVRDASLTGWIFPASCWWQKRVWGGWALEKMTAKMTRGRYWTLLWKSLGLGSQPYVSFFSWLFYQG